jgi:hypothetical protein
MNTPPVTQDAIRAALREAAEEFLRRVAATHPGETPYGFLFEISPSGFSAHGTVGTEEALTRFAEQGIVKGYGDDVESIRAGFRWGSPEDAWYQQPDEAFDKVNELLGQAEMTDLYARYDGTLETLCLEVLKAMDADGVFGSGVERERIVVGLCYIGGDNSAKEFLGWAKQVNPPKVYKRLRKEYLG